MLMQAQALHELLQERRLLRDLLALIRRCDGPPPGLVLDAVLSGRSGVRPLLPVQRAGIRPR